MTQITAKIRYRGVDPEGDDLNLEPGDVAEVSKTKAAQLQQDFPDWFVFGGAKVAKPSAAVVKAAEEAGLDLAAVTGTGKDGKVTVDDVKAAIEAATTA